MPQFLATLLRSLRGERGTNLRLLCRQILSQGGEASQTVLAQRIIEQYKAKDPAQQLAFFQMLTSEFAPDPNAVQRAVEEYARAVNPPSPAALAAAVEAPRQELFRRINTGPTGTAALVTMRGHLLRFLPNHPELSVVDADFKHLFRSWFNRGFLRLERIDWRTPARILEKLIHYESLHEINGWPDLRRRLEADRRCFAFFHPALVNEPIIFVEAALTRGLARNLEPLLDLSAPVLPAERADTAVFYSINNCLDGLRGIPFGNFLIKQVVDELGGELPGVKSYCTLSPLPHFAQALHANEDANGFTPERLSRLVADLAGDLSREAGHSEPVEAFFRLLRNPVEHREVLSVSLRRLALAYLTQLRANGKPCDPVAWFHFSNGARLESVDPFANLRPYGLRESFGVMANYRYVPNELEENHERFVRGGKMRVSPRLWHEYKVVAKLRSGEPVKPRKRGRSAT
jgi:malonyl-CoA decarboxylase